MNDEMSLQEQIQAMQQMRSDLEVFCQLLRQTMDSFQDDIKFLRSRGLPTEKEELYQAEYYTPANDKVEQVINNIHQKHFDYIDRIIDRLERILSVH